MDYKKAYALAVQKESKGDLVGAAKLYEAAKYYNKAIKIYDVLGDCRNAYRVAKQNSLNFEADRLALKYKMEGHEYRDFPRTGKGVQEDKRIALQSRLGKDSTARKLGFDGFQGKVVVDVGGGRRITNPYI